VKSFLFSLQNHTAPSRNIRQLFGLTNRSGIKIDVENPIFGHSQKISLGTVVFNAWVTIFNNGQFRPHEIVDALLENRLPQWYEGKIRNNGQPLSYYSLSLVEGNHFQKIYWNEKLHQELKLSKEGLQQRNNARETPARNNEFKSQDILIHKSHLKLNHNEIKKMVEENLGSNTKNEKLVQSLKNTFKKIGRDVISAIDFPSMKGSSIHYYVLKHFGPYSTKQNQMWWIQNCGIWNAPDHVLNGRILNLRTDPKNRIIELLK